MSSNSANQSTVLESMKRAEQQLVDGYSQWNLDAIMAPRSEDCMYERLPKSMGVKQNNEEFRESFGPIMKVFSDFKVFLDDPIFDVDKRTCAVHLTSLAQTPVGPYENEYAFFLSFNENGNQITRVQEFVDSAYTQQFFAKLQQYTAQQGETTV